MKKSVKILSFFAAILLIALSCKDEMTNEPFTNGSATIQGIAFAELDLSNAELEYVPQGVHIYAEINSQDLVQFPSGGVNYGTIVYDTTIGADGSFTFQIDANLKNVTVNFYSDDFRADQVQFDASVESKVFNLPMIYSVVVRDGVTKIVEVVFYEVI
jgi:hypothetical protein